MKIIVICFILILGHGCVPLSSFKSPEILQKDEDVFGLGNTLLQFEKDDNLIFNPSLWYRFPLSKKTEFGWKLGLMNGLEMDYKFIIYKKYIYVTGDISLGYNRTLYTNPTILLGNKNLYFAYKLVMPLTTEYSERYNVYIMGLSYRFKKITLLSELSFWHETGSRRIYNSLGIGIQLHFGNK